MIVARHPFLGTTRCRRVLVSGKAIFAPLLGVGAGDQHPTCFYSVGLTLTSTTPMRLSLGTRSRRPIALHNPCAGRRTKADEEDRSPVGRNWQQMLWSTDQRAATCSSTPRSSAHPMSPSVTYPHRPAPALVATRIPLPVTVPLETPSTPQGELLGKAFPGQRRLAQTPSILALRVFPT